MLKRKEKMTIIQEFEQYLKVDPNKLDEEYVQQTELSYRVSEAAIEATERRDMLKERAGRVDAELDSELRKELAKTQTRVTEAMVENAIKTHKKHTDAFDAWLAAKTEAAKLDALAERFAKRADIIDGLAKLYLNGYYGNRTIKSIGERDTVLYEQNRLRLAEGRSRTRPKK